LGKYEYNLNTGSWRTKHYLVGTWGFSCTFNMTMGALFMQPFSVALVQ